MQTHARTHTRTHARTHARTHTYTHSQTNTAEGRSATGIRPVKTQLVVLFTAIPAGILQPPVFDKHYPK